VNAQTGVCPWCAAKSSGQDVDAEPPLRPAPLFEMEPKHWAIGGVVLAFVAGFWYIGSLGTDASKRALDLSQGVMQQQENVQTTADTVKKAMRPSVVVKEEKPPDPKTAIPLEKAIQDGLVSVEAESIPFNSTWFYFRLTSKSEKPAMILIEPGWKIFDGQGHEYVTVLPAMETVRAKDFKAVEVRIADLNTAKGSRSKFQLERLPAGNSVLAFLQSAASKNPVPSWNVLQIAVWALTINVDLETVRKEQYSMPRQGLNVVYMGAGGVVASSIEQVDQALELLKKAGQDVTQLKLHQDSEPALAKAIADCRDPQKAYQTLYGMGFFLPRQQAFEVVSATFAEFPGTEQRPRAFRDAAFHGLSPSLVKWNGRDASVDERIREALERASRIEEDATLKQEMIWELEKAKKAMGQRVIEAVRQGGVKALEDLLAKGLDLKKDDVGEQTLAYAASNGYMDVVRLLLDRGVDPNNSGRFCQEGSVVVEATGRGYTDIVRMLLEKGAQADARDKSGRSALRLATERGHDQIAEALKKAGAKE